MKNRALTAIGSSLEWFDFSLYGFFAPIFSQIFFPDSQNHLVSLLTAYGVFAVGFVARPIGAILFGYIGDKHGRAIALKITPLGITFFTSIIAFFPNYDTAGSLSIVLLVIARIIQGVLLGGEYAGNIVYLYESSPFQKYLWGSFASCTGSLGIIFASGISALSYSVFSTAFLHNYGWRIAFLLSLPIGISIFLMRRKISESPEFITGQNSNPLSIVFKAYKKNVFIGLGIILLHATSFYFVFMFLPVFLTQIRHLPESAALINNTSFLILHLVLIPVFGWQ
ncbi:MAG: MFS transporter [Gammaproteobacteria bacterium]|nr:MFS transporter [Gammaproteobacteria bacterium]